MNYLIVLLLILMQLFLFKSNLIKSNVFFFKNVSPLKNQKKKNTKFFDFSQ